MEQGHRLIIWGAGGHGRVVADLVQTLGLELYGFADADAERVGKTVFPFAQPVVMTEEQILAEGGLEPGVRVVVGIGENEIRMRGVDRLQLRCAEALVHPSACVSRFATLGRGTIVMPGAVINAAVEVGRGVIINTGAIIEHDCVIGDGVHVSPGAVLAGGAKVGRLSWIGANATIFPGVSVGERTTVGAGTIVRRNLADHVTAVGNPARIIHKEGT